MNVKLIFLALIVIVMWKSGLSQTNDKVHQMIEDLAEEMVQDDDISESNIDLLENLSYYSRNPLNLNTATESQLKRLHILNAFQIKSLKDYLWRKGHLISIYELVYVFGFNKSTVERLKPFVVVKPENKEASLKGLSPRNMMRYGRNQLVIRMRRNAELANGFKEQEDSSLSRYLGDPYRLFGRYKYKYGDRLQVGFTMEKDPGEEFFRGANNQGFDFYSGHLTYHSDSWLKTFALGDYQIKAGQGLTLWSGFSLGKSPQSLGVMKTAEVLDGYSSANESNYFRGVATEIQWSNLHGAFFYSRKNIDASLMRDSEGNLFSQSFQNTGYHRTASEIANKGSVHEQVAGITASYQGSNWELGVAGVHYFFHPSPAFDSPLYKKFNNLGSVNTNVSIYYRYLLGKFYFYGEEAFHIYGGSAFLNGVDFQFLSDVSMTFLHRYYERNYVSKYGNAFGENSRNANEKGLYAGLNVKILPDLNSVFYVDVFRFPWLSYNVDGPSVGAEMLFHISYNFSENTQVYFRYKKDNKERNNQHIHLSGISATKMNRYRIHFQSAITENLAWKNRLEVSHYQEDGSSEAGWLFYQDFKYIIKKLPLTSHLRYAIFDTESYATRIYAYEHDVRYAFSIPAYYSNGIRVYWKVHYTLSDFDFYFKVGQTRYFNKDEIGSGLNLINGNTKTDLKFQVIYQF